MQIILLSGRQGSGKTTVQKLLAQKLYDQDVSVDVMNFADVIYQMHNAVLEVLHKYIPDRGLKKDGPLLQVLGTEWARKNLGENIWIDILKARAEKSAKPIFNTCGTEVLIVGDCRFENEFDAFPEALRVRLECPENIRKERCEMWRENTEHASETGLDKYSDTKRFDLYLYTHTISPEACVDLIDAQLKKNVWQEKRKAIL